MAPAIGPLMPPIMRQRQAVAVLVEDDVGVERRVDLQRRDGESRASVALGDGSAFRAAPSFWLTITAGMLTCLPSAPPIVMVAVPPWLFATITPMAPARLRVQDLER